ncbi:urokinase plasminogen activator surface receptor-like [Pempheris klunzingeri]|uniref:urokinase plasminogen activator surface receptor-like n=1 Tax=Pempheris klunzingeri TaxID=3127111 RepID=UPI00397FEBAA
MHLLMLILGIVLLPKVHTLSCFSCNINNTTCVNTPVNCTAGSQCSAMRLTQYAGDSKTVDISSKGCHLPEDVLSCGENSLNFGIYRNVITKECCASNLCNDQPAPEPSGFSPNGKRCFFCNGQTCGATLNCLGNEDRCVSASVGNGLTTMKGCASSLLCSEVLEIPNGFGVNVKCCQGDFCNGASAARAGLLLLVAPLVSLVMCAAS